MAQSAWVLAHDGRGFKVDYIGPRGIPASDPEESRQPAWGGGWYCALGAVALGLLAGGLILYDARR